MRKTSQDGGDTSSITSGIENEVKKTASGLAKIKRNSIKKKVQSLSHESDDGVGEPLLQKDKEKSEYQSAKYLLSKNKTDSANEKTDDRDMLLPEMVNEKSPLTSFSGITGTSMNGTKEAYKPYVCTANAIHNHMNINVFNSDGIKSPIVPKTQVLVEIDGNKQGNYSSSPLIFTTAKIHTDGKTKHMEPVQVTPVPILSTVEGNIIKTTSINESEIKIIGTSSGKSNNKISSDELSKLGSAVAIPGKDNPIIAVAPKVMSDDTRNQSVSNKTSIPNNVIVSTIPNVFTPALIDAKSATNIILKDTTSSATLKYVTSNTDKLPQTVKEISKPMDGKSTMISSEMDVNKNFQTDSSQSNIKRSAIEITSPKDKTSKPIVETVTPTIKPTTSSDKHVPSTLVTISSKAISSVSLTTIAGTTSHQSSTTGNIIPVTTSMITPNIQSQISTKTEVKGTPVLASDTLGCVKTSSLTLSSAPKLINTISSKEPLKYQEQKHAAAVSPVVPKVYSSATSTGKQLPSTSQPLSVTASSVVTLTSAKSKSVSTPSSGITSITANKSQAPTTTISSVAKKASTSKPISTTICAPSTTITTNIKTPNLITKNVTTTAEKSLLSSNKATSTTTSTAGAKNVKPNASIASSDSISLGKTITSTNKSIPVVSKNTSSSVANTTSSSSVTGVKAKDTSESKVINVIQKPSSTVVSKAPEIPSSSQMVTSTAKKTIDKSSNVGTKSSTSAGAAKASNLAKSGSSQIKENTRHTPVTTAVTESSQVSKDTTSNKSNELQSNEHKKERLK